MSGPKDDKLVDEGAVWLGAVSEAGLAMGQALAAAEVRLVAGMLELAAGELSAGVPAPESEAARLAHDAEVEADFDNLPV